MTLWHSKRERSSQTLVLGLSQPPVAPAQVVEPKRPKGVPGPHDRLLSRMGLGLTAKAGADNRRDLQRFTKKAVAARQFHEMLDNLKDQIAQKAMVRSGSSALIHAYRRPSAAA